MIQGFICSRLQVGNSSFRATGKRGWPSAVLCRLFSRLHALEAASWREGPMVFLA
jgi:hypothetical protein